MKANNVNEEEIAAILVRCQKREVAALESLYKKVAPLLNYFAMGIVNNESLSNEVLQDSFILIWAHADYFDPNKGKAITWLRTIVRNKAIDKLRAESKHNSRRTLQTDDNSIDDIPANTRYQPEVFLQEKEQTQLIHSCFAELPKNQGISLTLAYFYGCSRNELADSMDTNVNTIKSWLRRGLNNIKRAEKETSSSFL